MTQAPHVREVRRALARLVGLVDRGDAMAWNEELTPLLELQGVREQLGSADDPRAAADALRKELLSAVHEMGRSQYSALLRVVLGLDAQYAELSAGERREIAGRTFRGGHAPVTAGTIRQHHEPRALDQLAMVLTDPSRGSHTLAAVGEVPPSDVSLVDLLGIPTPTAEAIAERWRRHTGELRAVIGAATEGPFSIDLRSDGPHMLVTGTTGSGKSELLISLVASLAASVPPDRAALLLVDYKGGAAFRQCERVPHCIKLITNLEEEDTARRTLMGLNGELLRRERVLADVGANNLSELESRDPGSAPPSLVVIVDEAALLTSELPEFVDGLVDIARRGRSIGVHLVIATQDPAIAMTPKIRANMNLRIALRVQDRSDSEDVIDSDDAAFLPSHRPGSALARVGFGKLTRLQVASVTGYTIVGDESAGEFHGPTDLDRLIDAVLGATSLLGVPRPNASWLPTLKVGRPVDGRSQSRRPTRKRRGRGNRHR